MTTPASAPPRISDEVWGEMSEGMRRIGKELNDMFSMVPAWGKGHPWHTVPGQRREWRPEDVTPCGSQQRGERTAVVFSLRPYGRLV